MSIQTDNDFHYASYATSARCCCKVDVIQNVWVCQLGNLRARLARALPDKWSPCPARSTTWDWVMVCQAASVLRKLTHELLILASFWWDRSINQYVPDSDITSANMTQAALGCFYVTFSDMIYLQSAHCLVLHCCGKTTRVVTHKSSCRQDAWFASSDFYGPSIALKLIPL